MGTGKFHKVDGGLMVRSLTPSCGDTGGIVVVALPVWLQTSVVQDIRHLFFLYVSMHMLLCFICVCAGPGSLYVALIIMKEEN